MNQPLTRDQRLAVSMALWVADRVAREAARSTTRVPVDDLVQIARAALTDAARRFDPSKGKSLEAFAWKSIVGAVLDALGRQTKRHQRAMRAFLVMLDVPVDASDDFHDADDEVSAKIDERANDAAMVLFLALSAEDWQSAGESGLIRRESAVGAQRLVQEALESLSDIQKTVVHLRYWEELDWPDIVERVALSKTTVQYHERRARDQIRRHLLSHGVRQGPT